MFVLTAHQSKILEYDMIIQSFNYMIQQHNKYKIANKIWFILKCTLHVGLVLDHFGHSEHRTTRYQHID